MLLCDYYFNRYQSRRCWSRQRWCRFSTSIDSPNTKSWGRSEWTSAVSTGTGSSRSGRTSPSPPSLRFSFLWIGVIVLFSFYLQHRCCFCSLDQFQIWFSVLWLLGAPGGESGGDLLLAALRSHHLQADGGGAGGQRPEEHGHRGILRSDWELPKLERTLASLILFTSLNEQQDWVKHFISLWTEEYCIIIVTKVTHRQT